MNESLRQQTDAVFARWDRPDVPGCAVGIIHDGELVYSRGFGSANLEHIIPITSATVFDIASTSKQFTAACIALLAETSRLGLDDNIRRHVPELPDLGHVITLRHLLYHTSGWRDYLTLLDLAGYREADYTSDAEVMAFLTRQRGLNFTPGERYDYSNTGYYLLGGVVERVSGQTLADVCPRQHFCPAGYDPYLVSGRSYAHRPRPGDGLQPSGRGWLSHRHDHAGYGGRWGNVDLRR